MLEEQDEWDDEVEIRFLEKWSEIIATLPDPPLLERDSAWRLKVRWPRGKR